MVSRQRLKQETRNGPQRRRRIGNMAAARITIEAMGPASTSTVAVLLNE